MDIIKTKKTPFYKKKAAVFSMAAALFAGAVYGVAQVDFASATVKRSNLLTAEVKAGEFTIKVSGHGVLAPRDVRWVASNVEGKVEKILMKPGAAVNQGDLIVELANPELKQKVEELQWERTALEAELAALKVSQQTKLLDMQASLLQTKMAYDKANMRLQAEEQLIQKGNATVSRLDYESSKLTVSQLKETLAIDKRREMQLGENLKANLTAQQARLEKLNKTIERAEFQLASLKVVAPVSGILQAMPLELGQRVSLGSNVAKFAKQDDLIAELKIPELKASAIALGQSVAIDTRFNTIMGTVKRIDPAVVEGTVQVDVELETPLPQEARPDLSVDGDIIVAKKSNTLFVRRPAFSQAERTLSAFKLVENGRYVEKVAVTYGKASSTEIEIVTGLAVGDQVVISEQSEFSRHARVALN